MKNKLLTKITINIPEYMMNKIKKVDEQYPSTTRTGTILAILEKGLNWYAKAERKAQEQSVKKPGQDNAGQASTVDQEDNNINVDEIIEKIYSKQKQPKPKQSKQTIRPANVLKVPGDDGTRF